MRADATRPNMGLTTWTSEVPRKADVAVAKNYLGTDELEALNRTVTAYDGRLRVQRHVHGHPCADVALARRERPPGRTAFGWLVPASNRRAVSADRQEAA